MGPPPADLARETARAYTPMSGQRPVRLPTGLDRVFADADDRRVTLLWCDIDTLGPHAPGPEWEAQISYTLVWRSQ